MARKKPPPGATLISRLREGKARRQKAIEEKAAQEAGDSAEAGAIEAEIVDDQKGLEAAGKGGNKKAGVPATVQVSSKADLIHADISLDDLKPKTDDYDVLTDEIRLAGRFAAVGLIAQGLRLSRLRDQEIYKKNHSTFEDYCRAEHNMSATYAYRLIRISEMAERLALEKNAPVGTDVGDALPDPFEVMLGLGHRHIMALLPLEADVAEDLLIKGIPLNDESGSPKGRIPISQATEQQIKEALRRILAPAKKAVAGKMSGTGPPRASVRNIDEIAEYMLAFAMWLDSEPDSRKVEKLLGDKVEIAGLIQKLAAASQKLQDSLDKQR